MTLCTFCGVGEITKRPNGQSAFEIAETDCCHDCSWRFNQAIRVATHGVRQAFLSERKLRLEMTGEVFEPSKQDWLDLVARCDKVIASQKNNP